MTNKLLPLLMVVLLFSCQSVKNTPQSEQIKPDLPTQIVEPLQKVERKISKPGDLNQRKWQLKYLKGIDLAAIDFSNNGLPTIIFNIDNHTVGGNTGCNAYGGNLEIDTNKLKIGMLMSTKKYCEGIPEPELLRTLETCNFYEVNGEKLSLYINEILMLEFIEVK